MSGKTKAERLEEMKRLYIQRAYSDIEMGERLGVDRTLIYRDRVELSREYPIEKDDEGRHYIPKSKLISEIKLNLHEALTLYLAGRKTSRQTRFHQPHTVNAVEKLAATLRQPMTERLLKSAEQLMQQEKNAEKTKIVEIIAQAWVEQRKVKIEYQALGSDSLTRHTISPYIIEPSIWSDSVYVIAKSDFNDKMFAFKVERILSAVLSGETFEIPESFDDEQLLKHAWGIWVGDRDPVTVKLRFNRDAARRVKESKWHPLENVESTEDGDCIWTTEVAEWREMLPWVRGWGADCEVLEPKDLRAALIREAQSLAELYQVVEMNKKLFAHFREKDKDHKEPQYLWEHLTEASELAKGFASKIGLAKSGEILGLLHDLGKASEEFQNYLLSGEGLLDPDSDNYVDHIAMKGKVDHSTAGAQIIYNRLWNKGSEGRIAAQVLSLAIASHHSGMIDCLLPSGEDNFTRRMEKAEASSHVKEAFSNFTKHERTVIEELLADDLLVKELIEKFKGVKEENETSPETLSFKYGLLIRFLYSCLLDADRLNTADFEFPGNARLRNNNIYPSWESLIERLNGKIDEFENKPNRNEVDEIRSRVSQSCLEFSSKPKNIYQLTVPTGGGKTFASLRFALNHAKEHSMDRVFYVIPYTSIIDQNADEARKVLEDKDKNGNYLNKVVLEHHSNLTPDEETRRQNLLAENWDAPIVFTTQVQFLEALFGSGTRGARRMHQLANSVIIFDEIQTILIRVVHMFNLAIRFLVQSCGATVVLCTATQPLLDKVEPIQRALIIKPEQKIIPYEKELFQQLKRVEVFDRRKVGGWSDKETAELAVQELREKGSVLIVANTKKSAYSLYQAIAEMEIPCIHLYHLSTNMCPAHRLKLLNKIKGKLKSKMAKPVICVSTQLIEAGVDVDFGAVIRHLAGMDSIAQAAGRCNRNGVREGGGNVWVVNPAEENLDKLKDIKIGKEKAQTILDDFNDNPDSFENDRIGLERMTSYYKHYFYERQGEMNYLVNADSPVGRTDDLFTLLSTNESSIKARQRITKDANVISFKQSFQTAAKAFRVIDSLTQGVIVPYGKEGNEIIAELCGVDEVEKQYKLIKKAQRFSVNLFPYEFRKLADSNAIREVQKGAGIFYLDKQYYSEKFGWSNNPVNGMEDLIV
jgi:CRISPR-associated endonuclease/helicase Cas3